MPTGTLLKVIKPILVVRGLLHLNTVTEEAGVQVPVITTFQLSAFFQLFIPW